MDNIFTRQNEREFLLLQKAQRSKYSEAKKNLYFGIIVSIIGTIIFPILTAIFKSDFILSLSSFSAITIFAINEFLRNRSNAMIEEAAEIQQTVDVKLFQMPDRSHVLLPSEIIETVAAYSSDDLSEFKNWYNDYSESDFHLQVFYSQKENIRWDIALRRRYSSLLMTAMISFPVLLILYALFTGSSVAHFLTIATWLFPLEQFFITQQIGVSENISMLKKRSENKEISKRHTMSFQRLE